MPLPDRQTIKMTLLNHLGDGLVHRSNEIEDALIRHFALAPEDLAEVTKAGRTNNIVAAQYRLLRTRRYGSFSLRNDAARGLAKNSCMIPDVLGELSTKNTHVVDHINVA